MDITTVILTVLGLCLFEIISSIDNAIINAEVLKTMNPRAQRWFLVWGLLFAVFLVRGILPWLIVWITTPNLGFLQSLSATFSSDPAVIGSIEKSAPILLSGGGTFLLLLFIHWLFLEEKHFGLPFERFFHSNGVWFYAIASVLLVFLVWYSLKLHPMMALSVVIGSSAFFITHGFKQNAEIAEQNLVNKHMSDVSKILYLEIIDATFSIDGVLGAFAFTMSIPLILLGNGLGAIVVRQLTKGNIENIKKYVFLKNGAMYSVFFLGLIMLVESFGIHVPQFASPILTFGIILFFFMKSKNAVNSKEN